MGVPEATVVELERTLRKCDCCTLARIHATFDDPNLVSRAGPVPVIALAQRAGLGDLAAEHVRIGHACGVNAHLKVPCLAAGMVAGADSIDDMGLLWHRTIPALFGGIRAPSVLNSGENCRRCCPIGTPSARHSLAGRVSTTQGEAQVRPHRVMAVHNEYVDA